MNNEYKIMSMAFVTYEIVLTDIMMMISISSIAKVKCIIVSLQV